MREGLRGDSMTTVLQSLCQSHGGHIGPSTGRDVGKPDVQGSFSTKPADSRRVQSPDPSGGCANPEKPYAEDPLIGAGGPTVVRARAAPRPQPQMRGQRPCPSCAGRGLWSTSETTARPVPEWYDDSRTSQAANDRARKLVLSRAPPLE